MQGSEGKLYQCGVAVDCDGMALVNREGGWRSNVVLDGDETPTSWMQCLVTP